MKYGCVIIALMGIFTVDAALATTRVSAQGDGLVEAMDATIKAVEDSAIQANRCVTRYPQVQDCRTLPDQRWICYGERADKKTSCM